jgi:hypothetical protein
VTARTVVAQAPGARQAFSLPADRKIARTFGPFPLPPGDTRVALTTPEPAWIEAGASHRSLTFFVQDLFVRVGPAP